MVTEEINRLVSELEYPDPQRRRCAAKQLKNADERALYPLIKALEDEDPGVSDAAMRALINIGGEVTAYMMLPLLREHALLRNTALLILKEIGNIKIIRRLLNDKDDDVRKFGIDLISELKDKECCAYLKKLIKDPNPNVRAATASAIGEIGCHNLKDELIEALKDDEWVCFSAIDSIGKLKDPEFVNALIPLLDSPSEAIRYATLEALSGIPHPKAIEFLKDYLKKAGETEKRLIIKGLIEIGLTPDDTSLKNVFLEMLSSDDRDDMIHALKGLMHIRARDAIKDILDRGGAMDPLDPLQQDMITIIREAVVGIGSCESLIETLQSDDLKYRAKVIAIDAIGELGCKDAVDVLVELRKSEIRDIRRAGVKAIGMLQPDNIYEDIITAIDDPDGHVRRAAIKALGEIGDERVFEPLMEVLEKEPYRDVKEEAVITLIRLDEGRFLKDMDSYDVYTKKLIARFTSNPEVLVSLIGSKEIEVVRIEAIRRLGMFAIDEKYLNIIKELLYDDNVEIRRASVLSLIDGGYGDEFFVRLLDDTDMWVRYYAVKGIGAVAPEKHIDRLKEMLDDENVPVVMETVKILGRFLDRDDVREHIERLIDHPEKEVREGVQEVLNLSWKR